MKLNDIDKTFSNKVIKDIQNSTKSTLKSINFSKINNQILNHIKKGKNIEYNYKIFEEFF